MDFPTRRDSFLDNCFINRADLFGKTYPIKMLIKADHLGFIVPAGKKLKPIRQKVQFRDCREHRKRALYLALASECWDEVLKADNIETAVNILELNRGTQRQFSENICSEDDLRSRIFETFVVKFLACLPLLGFSNI